MSPNFRPIVFGLKIRTRGVSAQYFRPNLQSIYHRDRQSQYVALPMCSPSPQSTLSWSVERFWKHLRRKVTHNAFFQTIDRLLEAVTGFFQNLATRPDMVRSVAG
jgi:hypothetical protein